MQNIGILETHFHIKFLHTMMRICKSKNTTVTVFTTKKIFSRIQTYLKDESEYEIILKDENESINSYLKKVEKICNEQIDLLFVNTIQMSVIDIPHFIKFNPKSKMILTIHMTNHWLKKKIAFNIKNIFRSIDVSISIFLIRKFLLKKYNAINVIYPPIKEFVENETNYKKPVFILPFNFYEKRKIPKMKNEKIRIIIPGLIETYRRDYDFAINVFEDIFKEYNNKIMLIILGKPVGKGGERIIERCNKLKEKGYNIKFSTKFIPEKEYDKEMIESNIIFSPLNVKTKRDTGIVEIYGKTEGSALPFEAIQYMKPLILPHEFKIVDNLKSSTLTYKNQDELKKIIIELIKDKEKFKKLQKEAIKNSGNYSIENLQEYFQENIINKINKL